MTIIWSNKVDEIFKVGRSLDCIGVKNWALSKEESIHALHDLLEMKMPILGGDVYECIDGIMRPKYDNWYCEKNNDETYIDFAIRSIHSAKSFIENYNSTSSNQIYFVLVPEVNVDIIGSN